MARITVNEAGGENVRTLSKSRWKYVARSRGKASDHPLYSAWEGMRARCYSRNCDTYQWYGAVGITICERWSDFWSFVDDVGEKPGALYTLDRIDGSKGYCPENVRWASREVQSINQKLRIDNTSGRKGVMMFRRTGKWMAYISAQGKRRYLGYFDTFEAACAARENAERKWHQPVLSP